MSRRAGEDDEVRPRRRVRMEPVVEDGDGSGDATGSPWPCPHPCQSGPRHGVTLCSLPQERDRREDKEPAQRETPLHRPAAATGNTRAPSGPPSGPICEPGDGDTGVMGTPGSPHCVLQEVLSAQTAWQVAKLVPWHSPSLGEN